MLGEDSLPLLCQVLTALGDAKAGVLKPLLPDICHLMTSVAERDSGGVESPRSLESRASVMSLLAAMLFQTMKGHRWTPEAQQALRETTLALDAWSVYKVARTASRYGHYEHASELFSAAVRAASSEQMYFWLTGLAQVCRGEHILTDSSESADVVDRLAEANSNILLGISSINAATSQTRSQDFQIGYLKCRSEMLQALSQLAFACNSLRTSPPPAIASAQANQTHDDLQRCGRISHLLRQCVTKISDVAQMYAGLYEASFDADADTLVQLQLLRRLNSSLAQWIEMICLKNSLQGSIYQDQGVEFAPNLPKPIEEYGIEIKVLFVAHFPLISLLLTSYIIICFSEPGRDWK